MVLRTASLVVIIVVLAGCAGSPVPDAGAPGATTAPDVSTTDTPSQSRTHDASTTTPVTHETTAVSRTTQPPAEPANPWGKATLTVGVDADAGTDPDIRALTADAVEYWNDHSGAARYPITLEYRPDHPDPDIEIRAVDAIETCGGEPGDRFLGCAPVIEFGTQARDTEVARIVTGYTPADTRETIKHELGHLLGLRHGDGPGDVMAAESVAVPLREPSVDERENPWYWNTTHVYVDTENVTASDARRLREATEAAFEYYEDGADGYAPDGFEYVIVTNRSRADVVVRSVYEPACTTGSGSCQLRWGTSTDARDGVANYWTYQVIELHDVDEETWSWRVAYHFAWVLGAERVEDLPAPLRGDDWDDVTGDWWD